MNRHHLAWGDDDRVVPEPPRLWDAEPILFRSDGQPLKRQIGFAMTQTSGTFPALSDNVKKSGTKKTRRK